MTALTVVLYEDPRARGPVRRTEVTLLHPDTGAPVVDEHVRVRLPAPSPLPLLADVLVAPGDGPRSATALAARHPGALVVAVHRGPRCWLLLGGAGRPVVLDGRRRGTRWAVWASVAHAWLVAGLPVAEFGATAVRVIGNTRTQPAASPSSAVPFSPASGPSAPSLSRTSCASAESGPPTAEYRTSASR